MNMDPRIFDRAVNFLGLVLLVCVGGIIAVVLITDKSIPDVLQNIAIGSLTGLVGLLSQRGDNDSAPVPVTGPNGGPVLTTEKPVAKRARGAKGAVDAVTALLVALLVVVILLLLSGGDFRF